VSSRASRCPSLGQPARDAQALVEPQPAAHAVGHVELRQHRDRRADRRADRGNDLTSEAGTVFERPAVLVTTAIQARRKERAEQIVVAEVNLDGVEAGTRKALRAAGVRLGDLRDVAAGAGMGRAEPERTDHPRRCEHPLVGAGSGPTRGRHGRSAPTRRRPRRAPRRRGAPARPPHRARGRRCARRSCPPGTRRSRRRWSSPRHPQPSRGGTRSARRWARAGDCAPRRSPT
jgi:hypothetical protein